MNKKTRNTIIVASSVVALGVVAYLLIRRKRSKTDEQAAQDIAQANQSRKEDREQQQQAAEQAAVRAAQRRKENKEAYDKMLARINELAETRSGNPNASMRGHVSYPDDKRTGYNDYEFSVRVNGNNAMPRYFVFNSNGRWIAKISKSGSVRIGGDFSRDGTIKTDTGNIYTSLMYPLRDTLIKLANAV